MAPFFKIRKSKKQFLKDIHNRETENAVHNLYIMQFDSSKQILKLFPACVSSEQYIYLSTAFARRL